MDLEERTMTVCPDAGSACKLLAREIAQEIRKRAEEGGTYVMGLATGATPVPLYRELIRLHQTEGLSFANVHSFNLDEYHGLPKGHSQSYHTFMRAQLFDHIDMPEGQARIPDGEVAREEIAAHCAQYEQAIADVGGLDLQVLGIGRTGHIGFNEPGADDATRTRLVTLDPLTRKDAAEAFGGLEQVPTEAVTMGVATILEARWIAMLAWGGRKAEILARSMHEAPSADLPATYLQKHGDVRYYTDESAASLLDI